MAENQAHSIVADSDLDLWQLPRHRQSLHQLGQLWQDVADAGIQHLAALERRDQAAAALAKADQHAALLRHQLDAQAGLATIAPGLAVQRRQPLLRLDLTNALELGSQHVAFQPALPLWRDVLETAAAADTEMTAGRLDPIRRWLQHLHHFGLDDATAAAQRAEQDPFAGQ